MIEGLSGVGGIGGTAAGGHTDVRKASGTGPDFQALLDQLTMPVKAGEAAAVAGIEGKLDTRQVVDAVMAAEHSLQTVIAVRDKIVSAYLDLSRMQI
jgi:flagellar hook-basal body complex protein FliE